MNGLRIRAWSERRNRAVIVGCGPVGSTVARLEALGASPEQIDRERERVHAEPLRKAEEPAQNEQDEKVATEV